ncbi:TPA: tail fiber assembly protein [Enterobacter kobei]|uniref:tail fiber assembly protein n=1 Tax=Enterobacter kobei TaxID=208224 RepID=UPI000BB99508|nr:tail fiber assembly protein [Enterobacter kobei]HDS7683621.1 tail fiber assembly protein [Enterobacter kobei]HDT0751390.1 tail fiber assembly protein [Enterobacter kobei]
MQYAMVENSKIVNVAVWDGETKWSLDDGVTVINIDDISPQPGIGWSFDGTNFTAPPTPELTKEEYIAQAESTKAALLSSAQTTISIWQSELLLNTISDDDKASLINWLAYIKEVKAVDTSTDPDINWPTPPALQAS